MTAAAPHVVVVGAGNAALCAALSAREHGARVTVLEKAPREERGGNTYFTGGGFRFAYDGIETIRRLIPDLSASEIAAVEVGTYPAAQFRADLARVSDGLVDDRLADTLVREAFPTMQWMREQGMRWVLMTGRQANRVGEKLVFYGGLTVEAVGAGKGLSDQLFAAAERAGIDVRYSVKMTDLLRDGPRITGVTVRTEERDERLASDAVVLAAGGFEANAEMRARYLGAGWDLAKVRGTRFNTGDAIRAALAAGAQPFGNWSGAHAVAWDLNAPPTGNRVVGDLYQKHSYPYGLIVNVRGERFVDEGADLRNYTYANTAAPSCSSRSGSPFSCSIGKPSRCCATNTACAAPRRPRRPPSTRWASSWASTPTALSAPWPRSTRPVVRAGSTPPPWTACARRGSRRRSRTGRCRWTRRRSSASPSPAASRSPSAGSRSTRAARRWSTPRSARCPASTPPASWWAGCSTTTTRADPA